MLDSERNQLGRASGSEPGPAPTPKEEDTTTPIPQAVAAASGVEVPIRGRVKVSFNLPEADVEALKELAAWRDTTVTDALRGAVATEHYIREAVRSGGTVLLEGPDGKIRELVFR